MGIKIIAPVSYDEEARMLPSLGADELYFSFQPKNASVAISRRELAKANFNNIDEVELAVQIARKRGVSMFLATNKVFYTNDELPSVKKIIDECIEAGVDGLIVSDPGLMLLMRKEQYSKKIEIVLSAVASVQNTAAVRYFEQFGISRVILPRHISPPAAKVFVKSFKNIKFEVFILNWHCINFDGVCRFQHDIPNTAQYPMLTRNGCCLDFKTDTEEETSVSRLDESFNGLFERSESACAVCAMFDFATAGVKHFKIVGRLLDTRTKLSSVEFVHRCREILERTDSREKYIKLAQRMYENYYGAPCSGTCWHGYREL